MKRLALLVLAACSARPAPVQRPVPISLHAVLVIDAGSYRVSLARDGVLRWSGDAAGARSVDVHAVEALLAAAHMTPGMRCDDGHGRTIWYLDPHALPIEGVDHGCGRDVDRVRLGGLLESALQLHRDRPLIM